jgi:hypothetical protein
VLYGFPPAPPTELKVGKGRDAKPQDFFNDEKLMIANALLITIATMLAIGFFLMGEIKFFIPFKVVIWRAYSAYILSYCGLLFANVFAAAFALNRKFFLKDTGRKLAHLDKQFNVGQSELPSDVEVRE